VICVFLRNDRKVVEDVKEFSDGFFNVSHDENVLENLTSESEQSCSTSNEINNSTVSFILCKISKTENGSKNNNTTGLNNGDLYMSFEEKNEKTF
ncbi:hypothetical protein THOM_2703, partial [Trachipleistophora hominis]